MKKSSCMLAMLTLLVAGTASAAPDTTGADTFSARLAINNQTPFTLQYVGAYVDEHGQPLKKDEVSRQAIAPGSLASLGYGHAQDEQGRKIEGALQLPDPGHQRVLHPPLPHRQEQRPQDRRQTGNTPTAIRYRQGIQGLCHRLLSSRLCRHDQAMQCAATPGGY